MAEFNPTPQQDFAIHSRDKTLLVAAAAGSGKTAVLIRRIVSRLLDEKDPLSISDLLVVTYTKAAANEVKVRLKKELQDVLAKTGKKSISKELVALERARISTIHSFCQSVVRDCFQTLDVSPRTRIADETTLGMLKIDCAEQTLETFYRDDTLSEENLSAFRETVEIFSGAKSDEGLRDTLLSYYSNLLVYPYPFSFAQSIITELENDIAALSDKDMSFFETRSGKIIWEECRKTVEDALSLALHLENECLADEALQIKYYPAIHEDTLVFEILKSKLIQKDADGFFNQLAAYAPASLKGATKYSDPNYLEGIKKMREYYKKDLAELSARFHYTDRNVIATEMRRTVAVQKTLLAMAKHFHDLLTEEKKKAGVMDFADLEHFALRALVKEGSFDYTTHSFEKTPYAEQLTQELKEIYVDEYQDTNLLQDTILRAVSTNNDRFMVGDPKQSIYAFRGAMPALFRDYQKRFPSHENAEGDNACVFLSKNYRSHPSILYFTNAVCGVCMNTDPKDPMYTDKDALVPGRECVGNADVSLHIFDGKALSDEEDTSPDEDNFVAKEIARLISSAQCLPSDIAVLARQKTTLRRIEDALKNLSIPTATQLETPFFKQPDILFTLSFLHAIDNPYRDIHLLAIMDSPLFGFSPDELVAIRQDNNKEKFYLSLLRTAAQETPLGEKCALFISRLHALREDARILPADALIWKLFTEYHLFEHFPDPEAGKRLYTLHTMARQGETDVFHGLHHFLRLVTRQMEKSDAREMPTGAFSGEGVRLMTVHSSKGLEFPVVFYSGLATPYLEKDINEKAVFSQDLGVTFPLPSETGYTKINTCMRKAAQIDIRNRLYREEMRILYVALTRARDSLYLTASPKSLRASLVRALPDALSKTGVIDKTHRIESTKSHFELILLSFANEKDFARWAVGLDLSSPDAQYRFSRHPFTVAVNPTVPALDESETLSLPEQTTPASSALCTDHLKDILTFTYPHRQESRLPKKISVSQLKSGKLTVDELRMPAPNRIPLFMRETRDDGASHGTAMHLFMQYANFAHCAALGVRSEAEELVLRGFISPQDAEKLNFFALTRFFTSERFREIEKSPDVRRETRFNMLLSPSEIPGKSILSIDTDAKLLVQGVIDCYYQNAAGKYTVLDFKTDRVDNAETIIERYREQLLLYRRAVKELIGVEASECTIYSFHLGKWIHVD